MRRSYRYGENKWISLLLKEGSLKIGTLHNFRSAEHKAGIADPNEGKKLIRHRNIDIRATTPAQAAAAGNMDFDALEKFGYFKFENKSAPITITGLSLNLGFDEDDCFVLCSSYDRSRKAMEQFEGANACVEIVESKKLCSLITSELKKLGFPVIFSSQKRVIYKTREESWNGNNWGLNPALIKEPEFSPQCEIRAIWTLEKKMDIAPKVIRSPEIARCFKRVDYPSWR